MNLINTIFMTIPVIFDYEKLELKTNEEKQLFIDKFLKEVINIPLLIDDESTENEVANEKVMGVITEGKQIDGYNVNLFAMCQANIGVEFLQVPTTVENAKKPLGEKVNISEVCLKFVDSVNRSFFNLTQIQRDLAEKIKVMLRDRNE